MRLFNFSSIEHFSSNSLYIDRKNILQHGNNPYKQISKFIRSDFNNLNYYGRIICK